MNLLTLSWIFKACSRMPPNGMRPDWEPSSLSQSGGHPNLGITPSLLSLNSLLLVTETAKIVSKCSLFLRLPCHTKPINNFIFTHLSSLLRQWNTFKNNLLFYKHFFKSKKKRNDFFIYNEDMLQYFKQ